MSEQSGTPGALPATIGGAGQAGSGMLVEQAGLGSRQARVGGVVSTVGPIFRAVNGWVSKYFAAVLLSLIVFSIALTGVQHGGTLMGNQIKNALVLGAIYALVAIGYTMVYGIIELINFAHGDVFTASGFYAVAIAGVFHLDSLATSSFGGLLLALAIIFPLSMLVAGLPGVGM